MHHFWLIRHALVHRDSLVYLYGTDDVPVCTDTMEAQTSHYAALAARLPRPARLVCTPLSRTQLTADALMRAGYPATGKLIDPAFIEQNFGDWQGVPISEFDARPHEERHPFWPIHAAETPPGGESFEDLIGRVGAGLEGLLETAESKHTIIVSHGGAIRAACAYAMGLSPHQALCLQIDNVSLTRLSVTERGWRVFSVNEHSSTTACSPGGAAPPAQKREDKTMKQGVLS
ncbi:histidine phosphatase family protein [Acidocella aminolytica]|uniref:Phosphoglycerate/bisphosphoglycerate mutase n=1 Tax=Acidocella aminolytica 101 = DSM 11237 TaxID=1120923 RepID=A0A0D6PH16_9PROT|nr:histidine phosphatase family protein [Acidocella aminolytica]GAN80508.1 phosphoglycerate/bisphosphoglycerate mutase [Acidocella aminolytica 101 = DSM 11237]SHF39581.1 Broad specificity phosphatase PhoE [Acidocella aminolytica 101 = DSM 11237]